MAQDPERFRELRPLGDEDIEQLQTVVIFDGAAYDTLSEMRGRLLRVESNEGVVQKALELLLATEGKEVRLVDKKTGRTELVTLWREQ